MLYNHDDVGKFLLDQEKIRVQSTDLKIAMQMNNYDMVRLLIEKDRNCLRVRSSTHGDMIIHTFMRLNLNNSLCLETLLSFISDNELLTYLSEGSLVFGDNLLHIAGRQIDDDDQLASSGGENSQAHVSSHCVAHQSARREAISNDDRYVTQRGLKLIDEIIRSVCRQDVSSDAIRITQR